MGYRLSLIVIALWAGALWMTGLSAYVLFDTLQDRQLAGSIAGKLFTVVSYIGMASGLYLLLHRLFAYGTSALKQGYFWVVPVSYTHLVASERVYITSQNHGFAADAATLPKNLKVTHISLFDGSLQGIARTDQPAFSFQGHPEASPGPTEMSYLFDQFIEMMQKAN